MLIPMSHIMFKYRLKIKGILHVGAHNCEESVAYSQCGINPNNIYWIEAMEDLVNKHKSDKKIYQGVISDKDGSIVKFHKTNNGESSSILEFGSHEKHHPHVHVTNEYDVETITLKTLIDKNNIPITNLNFINLDIQGVELNALKGLGEYINHIDYIYSEVNTEEVYKGCGLITEIDEYLSEFDRVETQIFKEFGWGDALYIRRSKMEK